MSELEMGKPTSFRVNGHEHQGVVGESLLLALRRLGYEVPSLCYHEAVSPYGACRLCLVEVGKGKRRKLTTSCNYPVQPGIEVFLDTEKVVAQRKVILQLLLAQAPEAARVKELAAEYGVSDTPFEKKPGNACILCGLCARVCREIVRADAIAFSSRGTTKEMDTPYREANEACIGCGACVFVCPTDCIGLKDENGIREVVRWHRKLPLKKCAACGRPFAPTFQLNAFAAQIGVERTHFDKCPDCR